MTDSDHVVAVPTGTGDPYSKDTAGAAGSRPGPGFGTRSLGCKGNARRARIAEDLQLNWICSTPFNSSYPTRRRIQRVTSMTACAASMLKRCCANYLISSLRRVLSWPSILTPCVLPGFGLQTMDGDNKVMCGNCEANTACKSQLAIWSSPPIMVITLKRYIFDQGLAQNQTRRDNRVVKFPLTGLDMAPYVKSPKVQAHQTWPDQTCHLNFEITVTARLCAACCTPL